MGIISIIFIYFPLYGIFTIEVVRRLSLQMNKENFLRKVAIIFGRKVSKYTIAQWVFNGFLISYLIMVSIEILRFFSILFFNESIMTTFDYYAMVSLLSFATFQYILFKGFHNYKIFHER